MWRELMGHVLSYLLSAAFCVTAGVLGAVLYARTQDPPPRLVVMDVGSLVEPIARDPALGEADRRARAARIAEAVRQRVEAQAASGAIVLDASAVLRAPKDVYVKP